MKKILIYLIKFYQTCLSPYLGINCRYYPSCSEYAKQAIMKYGVIKGLALSIKRVFKCNPLSKGGYDPLK